MLRFLATLLLALAVAPRPAFRLYLADGNYHLVREYQVEGDRVRYYSVERSEWEEIPLRLVDLKRTEAERAAREETLRREAEALAAEERFEREQKRMIASIPQGPGVYLFQDGRPQPVPQAECKVATSRGRSVLKVLTPVPIVAGKATVEIEGERSKTLVASDRPEFFIRLSAPERFGIVRLWTEKRVRIVQKWSIIPVTNEIVEEQQEIEVFRRQLDDDLYQIWPVEPLKPGEYAVVQYTQGKGNVQAWDFSFRP